MRDATTQLNTPGPDLALVPGVHAMTDVTGFGLAGHALEMARGATPPAAAGGPPAAGGGCGVGVRIEWGRVPVMEGVAALVRGGVVTGASGRNWASYGGEVRLGGGVGDAERAVLTDPQTSGGLLVACGAEAAAEVLGVFRRHGFESCADIGKVVARGGGAGEPLLVVE